MLIESLIKPSDNQARNITLFGTPYRFTPVLPGRFVAEVIDRKHAETFLSNPAYRQFTDALPAATLKRGAEPASLVATAMPTSPVVPKDELPEVDAAEAGYGESDDDDDGGGENSEGGPSSEHTAAPAPAAVTEKWTTAIADEAATLLRNSQATLGAAIGRVSSLNVLRCALAIEQSKIGRQKPRTAVIGLIEAALRDAAAAGVR